MYSTVYLVSIGTKDGLFSPSPDWLFDEEMSAYGDYVEESQDFEDDVKWLIESGIEMVKEKGTNSEGEEVTVYRIVNAEKFIKKVTEQRVKAVQDVCAQVEKDPGSANMYDLSQAARPTDESHFICFGQVNEKFGYSEHCVNSYEFADFLKDNSADAIYIYKTYDYHL